MEMMVHLIAEKTNKDSQMGQVTPKNYLKKKHFKQS